MTMSTSTTVSNLGCAVTRAHEVIVCPATPAGSVGADIVWTVEIDGQESKSPTTSVAAPSIDALELSAPRLSTAGGDNFTLHGHDFGVRSDRIDHVACGERAAGGVKLFALRCEIVAPNVAVRCVSPPGVGVNVPCWISVGGQMSDPAVENDPIFEYFGGYQGDPEVVVMST